MSEEISEYQQERQEELSLIGAYHEKIWKLLVENDFKSATKLYYMDMPQDLYDKSMDILYNYSDEFVDEELRHLIKKIDTRLNKESEDNLDFEETKDNFNNQF